MDATMIWDLEDDPDGNVQHLREHDVTIEEAEEVLLDPLSSRAVSRTSGLPTAFGWTSTGRHLAVVYEVVDDDPLSLRPVTAYDVRERSEFARHFANFIMNAQGVRRDGAAALDLAYVAAGWYDGFFEVGLNPWDVAAGSLLVLEAGGLIGDLKGEGDYLHGGQVIAANPKIFSQMVQTLAPFQATLERDKAAARARA